MKPAHRSSERGANLVEFAILAPLLILLVFGIIDFGWAMGTYNDVRHGAREAARFAAVNAGDETAMGTMACNSMDIASGATVTFTDSATGAVGEQAVVSVTAPLSSISGLNLISVFLPPDLTSTVRIRLEQASSAWSGSVQTCP
jgi:Flp pilus assembly protein TadG